MAGDDEIDLVLNFGGLIKHVVAIEFKVGAGQRAKKGFYRGCDVVDASAKFVVHSGDKPYLDGEVPRLDLISAIKRVMAIASLG